MSESSSQLLSHADPLIQVSPDVGRPCKRVLNSDGLAQRAANLSG